MLEPPAEIAGKPRAGFFPGSTIGNFEPHEAARISAPRRARFSARARFSSSASISSRRPIFFIAPITTPKASPRKFNLNLLARINRELGANFDLEAFEHHAFYNAERSRIEMHLASTKRQKVRVGDTTIEFRAGETIHTENSYKYSIEFLSGARARQRLVAD